MIDLSGLNPEQRIAAETIYGPVLILAGAGSGKTRTVTYRIANMVANQGIPAKQILAVSFTNKAAMEMHERVGKLLGPRRKRGITLSTFHSLGIKILREDIEKTNLEDLPPISIIVPALNEEKSLWKTVGALVNADDPKDKLEVIIVNHGSTDNTEKVAKKFNLKIRSEW